MELELSTDWEIAIRNHDTTGEVTVYFSNKPYGPIVTGKNKTDALGKFLDAYWLFITATLCFWMEKADRDRLNSFLKEAKQKSKDIMDTCAAD